MCAYNLAFSEFGTDALGTVKIYCSNLLDMFFLFGLLLCAFSLPPSPLIRNETLKSSIDGVVGIISGLMHSNQSCSWAWFSSSSLPKLLLFMAWLSASFFHPELANPVQNEGVEDCHSSLKRTCIIFKNVDHLHSYWVVGYMRLDRSSWWSSLLDLLYMEFYSNLPEFHVMLINYFAHHGA